VVFLWAAGQGWGAVRVYVGARLSWLELFCSSLGFVVVLIFALCFASWGVVVLAVCCSLVCCGFINSFARGCVVLVGSPWCFWSLFRFWLRGVLISSVWPG